MGVRRRVLRHFFEMDGYIIARVMDVLRLWARNDLGQYHLIELVQQLALHKLDIAKEGPSNQYLHLMHEQHKLEWKYA